MSKSITILDVALARGVNEDNMTMGEFDRVGLPLMGGCQRCGACIAAYNASPSMTGYLMCARGCIDEQGFPSVKAYEAWQNYQDALAEALPCTNCNNENCSCHECGFDCF